MEGDCPSGHVSATPDGSPPNNDTSQQATASRTSTYPGTFDSQQSSRSRPYNNNQASANHIPKYQVTYAYQRGTVPSTSSSFNQFSQTTPNYPHGYGQLGQVVPSYPPNSQGMALYRGSSGPMNSYSNNGTGTPLAGSFNNFGHQDDVSVNRKRQDSSGTRVVSQPKRAKRESTEGDTAQKVGDRDLQTTQPRYGAYSHSFRSPDQARARVTMLQWTPPQDPHRKTPEYAVEMLPYVIQVYDAMVDTTSGFYDKVNAANRILNGKYPAEQLEATAWLIVDEAAALHRHGCCLLPFADPTFELKGTKAFIHEDRQLLFKDRIEAICDTFKVFKSACCEALDGAKPFKIVYGPTKICERTRNNAISNDRRAKKARIISGGSHNSDVHFRGDSEVADKSPDVDIGAQNNATLPTMTSSIAAKVPASFADSQHVGLGAVPSPPLKMEPPRTPRKSDPPTYNGAIHNVLGAHASPSNPPLLPDYLHYDFDPSQYSVGQFRPGLEVQSSTSRLIMPSAEHVDLTGTDTNSAPEETAINSWLRRRDDSDL
ncbi:hypothetical protein E2P81_ATG01988 [Venturia nashicola]|uniref:Uncharacterized protein n=1 Tax=Venturia nashicola TaxID=86259 RepID=A0A4Z1P4E8_9PEZI|nr:hypothetical protein E6O75_ATG02029 [Venturia nashicola]TLD35685.1 hypothetical protein E2P81_ATG01988 [Venturia nashicola]